ncbi:hypothetical protein HPB47_019107 [Ixodes persulcatus]|uniref:Uncharacterized protein n=1 Tax=Ixodes persulcatus TaxID=34615 RepID=A0AC60QJX2_IXOPE|nr:hypothetical protein HPB47_019107 [Ixodes persulcatus]
MPSPQVARETRQEVLYPSIGIRYDEILSERVLVSVGQSQDRHRSAYIEGPYLVEDDEGGRVAGSAPDGAANQGHRRRLSLKRLGGGVAPPEGTVEDGS